jgi:tetratricopeptide (TPR) repeat protein
MKRILIIAVMCVGGRAWAQDVDEATKAKVQALDAEGAQHFNLAEYDEAIVAYKEAYRLDPEPLFLYDIAQAYRQKPDCTKARTFYKSYLRNAPDATNRDKVDKRIAEMEECIRASGASIDTSADTTDAGAQITAGTDATKPDTTNPDVTKPDVTKPDVTKPDVTKPDTHVEHHSGPHRPPPVVVTQPAKRGGGLKEIAGIASAGLGAVLVATGVYFSYHAHQIANDVTELCAVTWVGSQIADLDREGRNAQTTAVVLDVAGGLAVIAGAGLYLWASAEGKESPVAVVPSRGGATVVGTWRW